ncbi:hypothetical protein JHD48_05840 [Sulfurimonas sp. SAG-AH-194-I05]|nr:hypothetical protein [Sulfurimonas sp. SAG-AH-194-I05]MDF1875247.1 hypothetical protein [Sulfurimonas sp. SAG-AH-194-I05]
MLIKIIVLASLCISLMHAGNSFNKVMAKNRASKKIGQANYKVINGNKQYNKVQRYNKNIGLDVTNKQVGRVYNYVEIKNVKLKKKRTSKAYGLAKIKKKKVKKKLYGVKINKNFKGTVSNTVIIKNSRLN